MKRNSPRSTNRPPAGSSAVVLGLDPGTLVTGYGVVARTDAGMTLVAYGTIQNERGRPMPLRLQRIHDELTGLIEKYHPDEFAIESSFYGKNAQSASNSAMREAWRFWQPSIGTFPPPSIHRVRSRRRSWETGTPQRNRYASWCDRFSAWTPPDSLWTHPTRWRSPSAISTAQQRGERDIEAGLPLLRRIRRGSSHDRTTHRNSRDKIPDRGAAGRPWGRLRPRNSSFDF